MSPWLMDKQELGPDRTSYGPHLCPLSPMMHPERPVQPTSHRLLGLRRQPASPSYSPSLPPAGGGAALQVAAPQPAPVKCGKEPTQVGFICLILP